MSYLRVVGPNISSQSVVGNYSVVQFGIDLVIDNGESHNYDENTTYGIATLQRLNEDGSWTDVGYYDYRSTFTGYTDKRIRTVEGITIPHRSNGTQSVRVTAWFDTDVSLGRLYGNSGTINLTSIDRTAPTVSFTVGTITTNSIQISATASANCDQWFYSLNGGATYTQVSGSGSSKTITINGLTPNQTVNLKVKARKTSNQVFGFSEAQSVTTIGNTTINSASDVIVDATVVTVNLSVTVFDSSFTNQIRLKRGSIELPWHTFAGWSSGDKVFSITAEEKSTLLNSLTTSKSITYNLECKTTKAGVQIGDISSIPITVKTTEASAPTFTSFSYHDENEDTVEVTGDNTKFIQSTSELYVSISGATAKNGATITGYSVSCGSKQVSGSSSTIHAGAIPEKGNVPLIVSVIDSRGYIASQTVNIDVIEYRQIDIGSLSLRRRNDVDEYTELSLSGRYSPISISGTDKNSLQSISYRRKKTSETTWGSWVYITDFTYSSGSFQYDNDNWITFDTDYSWDVQFRVYDKLNYDAYSVILVQGTSLLSLRKKKLGINNPTPAEALDVVGNALISGWMKVGGRSLVDIMYPPGTIVTLEYSISPEEIFGGHWEEIGSEHPHKWKRLSDIQIYTTLNNKQVYAPSYTFTASTHSGSGSYRIRTQYKLLDDEEYTYSSPGVNITDHQSVSLTVSGGTQRPISALYRIEIKDLITGEYQYSQAYQIDWLNQQDDFRGLDYVEIPISTDKYALITIPDIDLSEDDVITASIVPYGYNAGDTRTGQYIFSHASTGSNITIYYGGSSYLWTFRYAKSSVPEDSAQVTIGSRMNVTMTLHSAGAKKGLVALFAFLGTAAKAFYGKVYMISIKRNDEYIMQLIPKLRISDNVAGLYDTVTGLFYPSTGTQAFLPS